MTSLYKNFNRQVIIMFWTGFTGQSGKNVNKATQILEEHISSLELLSLNYAHNEASKIIFSPWALTNINLALLDT